MQTHRLCSKTSGITFFIIAFFNTSFYSVKSFLLVQIYTIYKIYTFFSFSMKLFLQRSQSIVPFSGIKPNCISLTISCILKISDYLICCFLLSLQEVLISTSETSIIVNKKADGKVTTLCIAFLVKIIYVSMYGLKCFMFYFSYVYLLSMVFDSFFGVVIVDDMQYIFMPKRITTDVVFIQTRLQ